MTIPLPRFSSSRAKRRCKLLAGAHHRNACRAALPGAVATRTLGDVDSLRRTGGIGAAGAVPASVNAPEYVEAICDWARSARHGRHDERWRSCEASQAAIQVTSHPHVLIGRRRGHRRKSRMHGRVLQPVGGSFRERRHRVLRSVKSRMRSGNRAAAPAMDGRGAGRVRGRRRRLTRGLTIPRPAARDAVSPSSAARFPLPEASDALASRLAAPLARPRGFAG